MASKSLDVGIKAEKRREGVSIPIQPLPLSAHSAPATSDASGVLPKETGFLAETGANIEEQVVAKAANQEPQHVATSRNWKQSIVSIRNRLGAVVNRSGLDTEEFTVISNDCWGQALYEGYGLPYQTPLVGSGMYADCFIRFLGNIEGYLNTPPRFVPETRHLALGRIRNQRGKWPIALLGDDVEVHFLHYKTEDESRRVWEAGCERLQLKRIAVKFSADKDGATQEHIELFSKMPFHRKLLLSKEPHPEIDCAVHTPNFVINGAAMFRRSLHHFDCTRWLNTGEIVRNSPRVWINKAIFARAI
jgi:uncharacterized protein (DUF1919 family)